MADTLIEISGGMFDSTEVVETVNGFPIGNKAVGSDFFAKMISTLYGNGISVHDNADGFKIAPGSGMKILCMPGTAWINGYMAWNKNIIEIPVSAGKNYGVYLRLNLRNGSYNVLCAEEPDEDTYPVRDGMVYDLVLAYVTVPLNAVSGNDAVINDTRYDAELCGVVTSAADGIGTIAFAANSGALGGKTADEYLLKSGGSMTGKLTAAADSTGVAAVRNISYGTSLPGNLKEGEIFILIS